MKNALEEDEEEKNDKKSSQDHLADEFLKTVESLIRKSQKETWLIHDHEHPYDKMPTK